MGDHWSGIEPTVPALLARAADHPDTDLLVTPTERLAYGEAERRSRQVARRMLSASVGKNTRVGILFATLRHLNHDYADRLESIAPELAARATPGRLFLPTLPHLRRTWTYQRGGPPWATVVDGTADDTANGTAVEAGPGPSGRSGAVTRNRARHRRGRRDQAAARRRAGRDLCVGVAHPDRGQDVASAVVPKPGADLDPEHILRRLREQLSSYKLPRCLSLLPRDGIPVLPNGKIDRKTLARILGDSIMERK